MGESGRYRRQSNYDKRPVVAVPGADGTCLAGWDAIARELAQQLAGPARVIAVECYTGVDEPGIAAALEQRIEGASVIRAAEALRPPERIAALVEPFLGGDDPVFGYMGNLRLEQFFDPERLAELQSKVERANGPVVVVGCGATLVHEGDVLVYADLARWEAQQRQRRGEIANLGTNNAGAKASLLYKRAYFVDWRVCDRHKRPLIGRWDYVLDTHDPAKPKLARGQAVRQGLAEAAGRPFRVVPFFDPGPWGGQWMREVCDLHDYRDDDPPNYAWCFDCVPEENALLLRLGDTELEMPSLNVVFEHPRNLLGDPVHARFGDEFPIRFDFLDTMGGGNLSLQVHPLTEFIQQHFGMAYTQDESYYLLDAESGARVYLGVRDDVDPQAMAAQLEAAERGEAAFDADAHVASWPAAKHDHFLIPAGTVHCSGAGCMVLEISATPYIFTFKLWDWGRLGLDGLPRPINLERGLANIAWDRTASWVQRQLINRVQRLAQGDGWCEQRTGLHEREFIETRRHWFTRPVEHDTGGIERGSVNVLNLVAGEEAVVESPTGAFEPFVVHYAETFIVPAAVGRYTVRPHGASEGEQVATIKASVRTGLT